MNLLTTRLVLRNDSTAKWVKNESVILLKGEVGIEFTIDGKVKIKIGDGIKPWSELSYFGGDVIGDKKSIDIIDNTLQLVGFDKAETGAYLIKGSDGSISWVVPENIDADEITTSIETIQTEIQSIQTIIGNDATDTSEATGLYSIINNKANADDVYTKDEIKSLISSVYKYCGSKPSYNDLPSEGQVIGDVWNIETDDSEHDIISGDNVVWNGSSWDKLGGTIDLSNYATVNNISEISNELKGYIDEQINEVVVSTEKLDGGEI